MNRLQEFLINTDLAEEISTFLTQYGTAGLKQALEFYTNMHQEYICKTKTSISKISICDIYYLEIQAHHITVHTQDNIYHKYGTLENELKLLSPYGFVKCAKGRIVSLQKIRTIYHDTIVLINSTKIHMSRNYAPRVIMAFTFNNKSVQK